MTKGVRTTNEDFVKQFYSEAKSDYELLSEYSNARTKIKVKHLGCGNIWDILPHNFIGIRNRCPICSNKQRTDKRRISHVEFIKDVFKLVGREYTILDECILSSQKIRIKHEICGHTYNVTPNKFKMGRRCPNCSKSNSTPEKNIEAFMKRNRLEYVRQFKFHNCRDKRELPFDFYLEAYNLCIEYDGEFHYDDKFRNPVEFRRTIKHDKIKTKFCKDNDINLLRIPYWEFSNIEKILTEALCL